ncbi:MAG: hypothetical protein PHI16_02925 [Methanocellales archaeon]|nr:hypothetical protein [Methanocellales archaeon]
MIKIKILCIFLAIMLLMPVIGAADNPTIVITDYQIYPDVLMPGDVGTITITIKNTATTATQTDTTTYISVGTTTTTTTTKNINADIESIYLLGKGIEVISGNYAHPGELGPGQSITITFAIKAPVKEGTYFPEVLIDVLGGGGVKYPIPIKVDDSDVNILASNLPLAIPKGDLTEIELSIANLRPNSINSAIITPKAEGIEFTPNEIFLGTIAPDEMSTVKFTLHPVSLDRKDLSFELTYKNGDNIHSTRLASSINVEENPGVELIVVEQPTSVLKGEEINIELDVANRMSKSVSSVRVVPMMEGDINPSEYFIGEIKSEQKATTLFNLDTTDLPVGRNDIDFKVSYRFADRYQESSTKVSINVIDEPGVILILTDAPASVPRGEYAEISFDVANSRSRDVTGVRVIPVTDLRMIPSEVFIGTMEPDDVFSARFEIDTRDIPIGRTDIGFKVVFKDGSRSYESKEYTVPVGVVEIQSSSSISYQIVILLIVVALVIGGYYVYRHRRSKFE